MLKKIGWIGASIAAIGFSTLMAVSQSAPIDSQILVGRWEGRVLDQPMGLRFSPTGKMIAVLQPGLGSTSRMAFSVNYSIDPTPKPMHLDLQLDQPVSTVNREKPVLTIFELPNPRTLRLQVKNLTPGQPRPTKFLDEVQLSKVSESAIVFPDAPQLAQAEQSKAGEGRLVMRNLALSILYYSLEMKQFPAMLNQLGLSNDATQNYRYQLQAKSNHLTLIARPNKGNLKSYIAIVLRYPVQGQDYSATSICESVRPSTIAPPTPKLPAPPATSLGINTIQCGSGSEAIEF